MLEVLLLSIAMNGLFLTGFDATSKHKGSVGVVKDTGEKVCIMRDQRGSFLIRHEDGTRSKVKDHTVKVLDELCI